MTAMQAYEQMTQREKDEYNALVARLDDLLVKKSRERRKAEQAIAFDDRRQGDRRRKFKG